MIPKEAVESSAKVLHDCGEQSWLAWDDITPFGQDAYRNQARKVLEAAAPHMPSNDEAKLAAIIILLDRFDKVTKWMETSDETGGYADEALSKIRVILDTP